MVGGRKRMYNLGGIYYQMKSNAVLFAILAVVFFVLSRFWNLEKRNMKEIIIGLVCIALAISSIIYYSIIINSPKILVYEGYYVSEHRVNTHILKMEYCFTNGEQIKPVFYLDGLTKKEIYPKNFETEQEYRIFYEEETDMIVKVEEIE